MLNGLYVCWAGAVGGVAAGWLGLLILRPKLRPYLSDLLLSKSILAGEAPPIVPSAKPDDGRRGPPK